MTPKVRALSAKHGATPSTAMSAPAIAGPMIRDEWMITLLRLTALTTRSAPTISITKLCRAGLSIELMLPRAKAVAKTIQGATTPAAVTAKSPSAGNAIAACV